MRAKFCRGPTVVSKKRRGGVQTHKLLNFYKYVRYNTANNVSNCCGDPDLACVISAENEQSPALSVKQPTTLFTVMATTDDGLHFNLDNVNDDNERYDDDLVHLQNCLNNWAIIPTLKSITCTNNYVGILPCLR